MPQAILVEYNVSYNRGISSFYTSTIVLRFERKQQTFYMYSMLCLFFLSILLLGMTSYNAGNSFNELIFSGKFIGRIPFATAMMNLGASNDGNISSSSPFTLKIDAECYESCKIQTTFLSNVMEITQLVCSKF